jgi:hypothetical protein
MTPFPVSTMFAAEYIKVTCLSLSRSQCISYEGNNGKINLLTPQPMSVTEKLTISRFLSERNAFRVCGHFLWLAVWDKQDVTERRTIFWKLYTYFHVFGVCVTNNNGFRILLLDLFTLLYNYNKLWRLTINDCLRLAPFVTGPRASSLALWRMPKDESLLTHWTAMNDVCLTNALRSITHWI